MKFSRRELLTGASAASIALGLPRQSEAWTHGVAPSGVINGSLSRVLINVPSGAVYLNLAKGWPVALPAGSANQTSDGYPVNGVLATSASANFNFPAAYFGKFAWAWTGTGGMDMTGAPWIVYSGGLAIYPNSSAATDGAGGFIIGNGGGTGIANPLVVFNFGWNIQSVSNDGTGKILITVKSTYLNGYTPSAGQKVLVSGTGTSADSATPWTIASYNLVANTFVLAGSTFVSGNASAAGSAILDGQLETLAFRSGQTFTNMTGLIVCKYINGTTDDYHDITVNGYIADTVLVNQLIYLMNSGSRGTPGWLRFMDLLTGGRGINGDFANRLPVTAVGYNPNGRYVNNYWAGTVANASGALSCSDPVTSVWGGSNYIDGATVQGKLASTDTTGIPTLAVGGHPALPLYSDSAAIPHLLFKFPAAPTAAGQVLSFTFNVGGASYLNGGANYTFQYTTITADTSSVTTFLDNVVTAMNDSNNTLSVNSKSGGYIQVLADNTNLRATFLCPTPLANGVTGGPGNTIVVTYSGTPICNLFRIPPSSMVTTGSTFTFNALLNGWIYDDGTPGQNLPLELLVDMCNRVGAHCYFCWDITTSAYITSVTNFFATNLTSGLKFGTETGNEVWNSGTEPYHVYSSLGSCFGWNRNLGQATLGYCGLRTVQFAAISRAAWAAAGKPAANHVVLSQEQIAQTGVNSDTYNYQLTGTLFNGSTWPIYATHGGLGGGSTVNHNTAGTRPIDATDYIGCAPYWGSPWFGGQAGGSQAGSYGAIVGTVAQNAPILQASYNYANGASTTAFASLVNQFNGTTQRSDFCTGNVLGPIFGGVQGTSYDTVFVGMEATAAAFDTYRMGGTNTLAANNSGAAAKLGIICYEGGPNWAMGNDPNNGVNSPVGSPAFVDLTALAIAFVSLGWGSVSAYTLTGTPTVSSGSYNSGTGVVTLILATPISYSAAATFTGSISANTLTVASGLTGTLSIGQNIGGAGIAAAIITSFGSGTGGLGTYGISGGQQFIGSQAITAGDSLTINLTGTGSVASLNGAFVATPTTSGTTVTYKAGVGLTLTITGGTVFDQTAGNWEVATNILNMAQAWKYDASYKNLIKTSYYQKLYGYSGANREVHPGQYGYNGSQWGLFPGAYSAGNQYMNYDAIREWNA